VVATWLECPYFEGALADAPACAGWDASNTTAAMASVPVTAARHLYMTASIWCETTQTEQSTAFQGFLSDDSVRRRVVPKDDDDPALDEAQGSVSTMLERSAN
jgi:hypothetical protein